MKPLISFLFLLISFHSEACSCFTPPFMVSYQQSDFIAIAKIKKISGDEMKSPYRYATIEIAELFKGEPASLIKEVNINTSNCGILTPENTTWLLFATRDSDGILQISLCSGAQEIKEIAYDNTYPAYKKNREAYLSRTLEVLRYLKKERLDATNEYHLTPNFTSPCFRSLQGFESSKQVFSVFELTVQKDLTISNIKAVKEFSSQTLSSQLFECIKQYTKIANTNLQEVPGITKVLLIFFYYAAEGENKSFISLQNL